MEGVEFLGIDADFPLKGKRIILGVCGSIAAYKAVYFLRLLQKQGAEVQVVMTPHAEQFVTPLTFSTLSRKPVFSYLWHSPTGEIDWSQHVQLAERADLIVIAPATMNTIAKLACGICEDALTATVFSASCPVLIAPAMDRQMFQSPQNQKNIALLKEYGYQVLPTESGYLASGLEGEGRLLEPENLLEVVLSVLTPKIFHRKRFLINVGPTREDIDPVRFISNHSSGKMGLSIAKWAHRMGGEVLLVSGPLSVPIPDYLKTFPVHSAQEMLSCMQNLVSQADYIIGTAAVADYRPKFYHPQKIKKEDALSDWVLELTPNPDILAELAQHKKNHQIFVGFALETHNALENAKKKLLKKNLDLIVLNVMKEGHSPFGQDTNQVHFISRDWSQATGLLSKEQIAVQLLQLLKNL